MTDEQHVPEQPAESRSKPRKTGNLACAGTIIAALGLLILAPTAGVLAYRRVSSQTDARAKVRQAAALIDRVDATIRDVDELMRARAKPELAEDARVAVEKLPAAKRRCDEAAALYMEAAPGLSDAERGSAEAAAAAAQTRRQLLDSAAPVLAATERACAAIGPADEAWAALLDAEAAADEAARLSNGHDATSARKSNELVAKSDSKAQTARTLFMKADSEMPDAGLGAYTDIAEERIALLDLAKRANDAFLDGRIADANAIADRYNKRERELATDAKKLPASPGVAIDGAYNRAVGASPERYFELRERLGGG